MKAVISNRIYLNTNDLLMENLESNLTYKFAQFMENAPPIIHYDVTAVGKGIVSIPIGRLDLIPKEYEIIDKRAIVPAEFPKANFKLREDQQEIHDFVDDSCIINAQPGWGKTFTALAILKKLGQKTLVIVHTVALRDQWEKEIIKVFYNI